MKRIPITSHTSSFLPLINNISSKSIKVAEVVETKLEVKGFTGEDVTTDENKLYTPIVVFDISKVKHLINTETGKESPDPITKRLSEMIEGSDQYIIVDDLKKLAVVKKAKMDYMPVSIAVLEQHFNPIRNIQIKDPLIVIGNGPSVKDIDLDMLRGRDTYGLKGAYVTYPKLNWYPKYWSTFDFEWLQSGDRFMNVLQFVQEDNPVQHFIFLESNEVSFGKSPKIHYIKRHGPKIIKNGLDLMSPWDVTKQAAAKKISELEDINEKEATDLVYQTIITKHLGANITASGIVNAYQNKRLTEDDYDNPKPGMIYPFPTDIDKFYYYGGSSAHIACNIGVCLGYKKIILLGVDCSYAPGPSQYWSEDIVTEEDVWKNPDEMLERSKDTKVSGKDFTELTENINKGHIKNWTDWSVAMIEEGIDVVNCGGPKSKLECFRRGKLEDEI